MVRFGKKEQSDHCRVIVEKKQYLEVEVSSTRSNLIILHVYELNTVD